MSSIVVAGDTSGSITLLAPNVAGSGTLTLPIATDTLVGKATTDTLTNKTLTGAILVAPVLGTPVSGSLLNCTFPTLNQNTSGSAATVTTNANLTGGVTSVGNTATVITNADLSGDVTSVGNTTTLTNAPVIAKVLTGFTSGAGVVSNTDSILTAIQKLNGNDATNANLTGMVTSAGNATTVVTNANLTGDVTSVGNTTTLTNAPVIAKVLTGFTSGAGTVTASDSILTAIQKLNGNVANATVTLTGDVTSSGSATTVVKINGTLLSGLATGLLKNTTSTGTPSIAVKGTDYIGPDGSGNVGIGPGNINARLSISVASTEATVLQDVVRIATTERSSSAGVQNRGTLLSFADGYNYTLTAAIGGLRANPVGTYNGGLAFYVNNTGGNPADSVSQLTERMRIDNSGNVFIKGNAGAISHTFAYNENGGEVLLHDENGTIATLLDQMNNSTRLFELINGSALQVGLGSANTTGIVQFMGAGNIERMQISAAGNVTINTGLGVGTAAPTTAGEIRATNMITSFYSDERLKENITIIDNALEKVMTLRGVTYNSNDLAESFGYTNKEKQVGVIANDVQQVLPEAVKPAPFDIAQDADGVEISKSGENYKTVQYERLVPLLIEAIKELKRELDSLKG